MSEAAEPEELDALADAFPPVDRATLEKIAAMLDEGGDPVRFETVASVLEQAAAKGKVPDRGYLQMAAAAADYEPMEMDVNDPLDEPPDADPTSPRNADRAEQAMATIRREQFPRRAERAASDGSIPEMIELLETVNRWANEALLAPDRGSVPADCKEAIETLGDAILLRIDALAAQGKREKVAEAKVAAQSMSTDAFQRAVIEEADQKLRLLDAGGSEYDDVRERVLDEGNTPQAVQEMYQDALDNADITYEQAVELGEDVTDWLEEYREAVEQS